MAYSLPEAWCIQPSQGEWTWLDGLLGELKGPGMFVYQGVSENQERNIERTEF